MPITLTNLFKENGLEFGGWINGGITYNANNPSDGSMGQLLSRTEPTGFS